MGLKMAEKMVVLTRPFPMTAVFLNCMEFSRRDYWSGLPKTFSRGSSWLWDWTRVSCTGRWILYLWVTWRHCYYIFSFFAIWLVRSWFPDQGLNPCMSPAVEAPSPNHWTTREFSAPLLELIDHTLTCIFWRLVETSLIFWGMSKHLAVVIFALTNHCWKSLKALRNLCCKICSLFWQPLDACKQRLEPWFEAFNGRKKVIK